MRVRRGNSEQLATRVRKAAYRIAVNVLGLIVAAQLVDGIVLGGWQGVALAAAVFGLVNAFIKPVVRALTCPLYVLTLGLFAFVVNAVMLMLTSVVTEHAHSGFRVDGFGAAFYGAVIVSIVSFTAAMVF